MGRLQAALRRWFHQNAKPSAEDLSEPIVVVGPVIGKVTSTSARVLLELDESARIVITLVLEQDDDAYAAARHARRHKWRKRRPPPPGGGVVVARKARDAIAGRPFVVEFEGLDPGARYRVVLEGCRLQNSSLRSGFRTFRSDSSGDGRGGGALNIGGGSALNIGVVSCNKVFVTQQEIPARSDLWGDLASRVEAGEIDLLLHLGDQVYGDGDKVIDAEAGEQYDKWSDRFRLCTELMKDIPCDSWPSMEAQVCERYREVYRESWGHAATARCLAGCPNLMIYDDHEIRDNWADLPADWTPGTLDFFIARCAWIVYLEYQRQLYEDVDFSRLSSIKSDYHFHVLDGLGIMFLDERGSRSFHRVEGDPYPYLGTRQWADVDAALAPGGLFSSVRLLLVCTPAPLVFLEPHITNVAGKNVPRLVDFRGHWSADLHIKEQTRMIKSLWQWKCSQPQRELLILGGDVHSGGHSHVLKDNRVIFNQLTTSAIANRPLPRAAYYFMRAAGRLGRLEDGFGFRHHHWTRSRNYAIVQIRNYRNEDPANLDIVSYLIIGKSGTIRPGKRVRHYYVSKRKCGCV